VTNITEKQKQIYNCYLKHSRKGEPYNPRKNFDDVNSSTRFELFKLENFFNKFKHINLNFFFESFCFVYPDEKYPPLSFFTTRKAIKCFSMYKKHKENMSPDTQLEEIKQSIVHIGSFCLRQNILFESYIKHKTLCMPTWVKDYKEGKINIYSIIAMGVSPEIGVLEEDERNIWIPNLLENIESYKIRLNNSKSKEKINAWIEKTKNFVKNSLTNYKK
jgi:hypothetical protein